MGLKKHKESSFNEIPYLYFEISSFPKFQVGWDGRNSATTLIPFTFSNQKVSRISMNYRRSRVRKSILVDHIENKSKEDGRVSTRIKSTVKKDNGSAQS